MSVIICDVDLTLVDSVFSPNGWFYYLQRATNAPYTEDEWKKEISKTGDKISYDLSEYFKDVPKSEAFYFWQQQDLYQKLEPYKDAVDILTLLGQTNKIVFASYCKQFHQKSKYKMIKDTFRYKIPDENIAFIATKEKWAVLGDVVIEDRNCFLNQFSGRLECLKIKIATPYTQDVALSVSLDLETNDWKKIGKFINDLS